MAVNNPATVDSRVVRSAESLQDAGFEYHVVGTLRKGFPKEEIQNGVVYHRVPLRCDALALLAGYFPALMYPADIGDKGRMRRLARALVISIAWLLNLLFVSLVVLVKGWFEDTIPPFAEEQLENQISLAHIDCDMRGGTVVVFDELTMGGDIHNELKAFYEFMVDRRIKFEWIGRSQYSYNNVAVRIV